MDDLGIEPEPLSYQATLLGLSGQKETSVEIRPIQTQPNPTTLSQLYVYPLLNEKLGCLCSQGLQFYALSRVFPLLEPT